MVNGHREVPKEWSSDTSHARSFAVFYEQHVKKGKFAMNSSGRVSQLLMCPGKGKSAPDVSWEG